MAFNAFAQYRVTAVGLVSLRGQSSAALPSPRTDMTTSSAYRRPSCYHPRSHMITLTVSSIRSFSVTTACNQRRTERDKVHKGKQVPRLNPAFPQLFIRQTTFHALLILDFLVREGTILCIHIQLLPLPWNVRSISLGYCRSMNGLVL